MNRLRGEIANISVSDELSRVCLQVGDVKLYTVVIETPETAPYLAIGKQVQLLFKETEVILAKPPVTGIAVENRIDCVITSIESAQILSAINLDSTPGRIQAIVSSEEVNNLELKVGDKLVALIKTNEIMLST